MINLNFEEFTLFDIFTKNNELFLILSINNDPISENNIILKNNNKIIKFKRKLIKDTYEPILIFIYEYPVNKNTIVDFIYINKNNNKIKNIINVPFIPSTKKGYLAITTLFKDDYHLFPIFYNYYMKQGVDHFYMYYNGIIDNKIKNMFDYDNVTLIEWNFRYWNYKKYKYIHHAQIGQLHDALHKYGKNNYDYMIFCDLDEYFYVKNKNLKLYIQKKKNKDIDIFGFCNKWAITLNDKIPENELPSTILINDQTLNYPNRSKNIYKLDNINLIGIHHAYLYQNYNIKNNLIMFHFYKWGSKSRKNINDNWHKKCLY